jgi:hypothetical protein
MKNLCFLALIKTYQFLTLLILKQKPQKVLNQVKMLSNIYAKFSINQWVQILNQA